MNQDKSIVLSVANRNCPCIKCKDRQVGCHSNCKKYNEWKNEYKNQVKKYRKERGIFNTY